MPAISTQGLASGIQAGFGMARQVSQDEENKRRYEAQVAADAEARTLEADRYTEKMRLEALDRQNTATFRQTRLENDAASAAATAGYRQTQADTAAAATQAEIDKAKRDALKERGLFYVGSATLPNFAVNPELEDELNNAGLTRFIPSNVVDTENLATLANLERMGKEIISTQDLGRVNSPEFLDLYNRAFDSEISTGSGQVDPETGKVVKDKRVVNFRPVGNGKFATEVVLVFEDDTQSNPRPVTIFRSSNPNDPVTAEDPGAMIDMVLGRAEVARRLSSMRGTIQDAYDMLTEKKDTPLPAAAATVEYYRDLGYSTDEAVRLVTQSKSNPQATAARVAEDMVANDKLYGEGDLTFDQAYQNVFTSISGAPPTYVQSGQSATPQPQSAPRPTILGPNGERMQLSEDGSTWEPVQ